MNHLAHLLLAGPDPDLRFGALLADHVKGRAALETLTPGVRQGVILHRRIDGWCDRHPAVTGLIEGLEPPWRRYGGIMLDVLFDHMLDRHWQRFADVPQAEFGREIDRLFRARLLQMPPRMARFTLWASTRNLWQRYGERRMLDEIFQLLARRHGREYPLARGTALLDARELQIEQAFLALFPDLQAHANSFLNQEYG